MSSLQAPISMTLRSITCCLVGIIAVSLAPSVNAADDSDKKLKILLVAGGCCHDYPEQTKLLKEGLEKRINSRSHCRIKLRYQHQGDIQDLRIRRLGQRL